MWRIVSLLASAATPYLRRDCVLIRVAIETVEDLFPESINYDEYFFRDLILYLLRLALRLATYSFAASLATSRRQ